MTLSRPGKRSVGEDETTKHTKLVEALYPYAAQNRGTEKRCREGQCVSRSNVDRLELHDGSANDQINSPLKLFYGLANKFIVPVPSLCDWAPQYNWLLSQR